MVMVAHQATILGERWRRRVCCGGRCTLAAQRILEGVGKVNWQSHDEIALVPDGEAERAGQLSRRRVLSIALAAAAGSVAPRQAMAADPEATIEALERELNEKDATIEALQTQVAELEPTSTPTPTPSPAPDSNTITQFGQEGTIRYLLNRWTVTFDPNVEVRTFIGDYSIVPRRGQFLVIWFAQQAVPADPLPLANFDLQVLEPDSQQPVTMYPLAQEGTLALARTEFDWVPDLMQSDYIYRTGVVFDIRPEDVHFRLLFRSAGLEAGEKETWVDIEFTA